MSKRTEQLSSVIHRAVQSVLSEGLSDPRLQCTVTITNVRVTEDKQEAIINVSIMPEKFESRAMKGLADAANFVRREAGERVAIARMPGLVFKLDRSSKRQAAVLAALADVAREREAKGETGDGAGQAAGPGAGENSDESKATTDPRTDRSASAGAGHDPGSSAE